MTRLFLAATAALLVSSSAYAENMVLQCGSGANAKVFKIDTDKGDGVDVLLSHYLAVSVSDVEFRIADLTEDSTGKTIKYRILRPSGSLYSGDGPVSIGDCAKSVSNKF